MTTSKKEFEVPEIPEREKVINKVLAFLEKYSGSTVDDIGDGLGVGFWAAYQALQALKGRGEIESKFVGNTETFRIREYEEEV